MRASADFESSNFVLLQLLIAVSAIRIVSPMRPPSSAILLMSSLSCGQRCGRSRSAVPARERLDRASPSLPPFNSVRASLSGSRTRSIRSSAVCSGSTTVSLNAAPAFANWSRKLLILPMSQAAIASRALSVAAFTRSRSAHSAAPAFTRVSMVLAAGFVMRASTVFDPSSFALSQLPIAVSAPLTVSSMWSISSAILSMSFAGGGQWPGHSPRPDRARAIPDRASASFPSLNKVRASASGSRTREMRAIVFCAGSTTSSL